MEHVNITNKDEQNANMRAEDNMITENTSNNCDCETISSMTTKAAAIVPLAVTVSSASYVVYKVGNTINAMNGITGVVDNSGTNAATVIQYAINNAYGGSVFIQKGTY